MQYRSMHADLLEKGRGPEAIAALKEAVRYNPDDVEGRAELARAAVAEGDLDGAKVYLDREIAGEDPVAADVADGDRAPLRRERQRARDPGAAPAHRQLAPVEDRRARLDARPGRRPTRRLSASTPPSTPSSHAGNYMDAAAMLQEFVTRVSGQIGALLKLVEICVDGGLEATMYEAQASLADAYLEAGQGGEARVIAEDLVAREPWEHAHIERFRRALVMLEVPDPDTLIADRLSGHSPFISTDPFMAPETFGAEPPATDPRRRLPGSGRGGAARPPSASRPRSRSRGRARARSRAAPPARRAPPRRPFADRSRTFPCARRSPAPAPPKPRSVGGLDIDSSDALAELRAWPRRRRPSRKPAPAASLDDAFQDFRSEVSRQSGSHEAGEHLALARDLPRDGHGGRSVWRADRSGARSRLSLRGGVDARTAVSEEGTIWRRRPSGSSARPKRPAPTAVEGRELLYDLGAILETLGETARALAVFLELQAEAGEYRDVAARVERLARVQTGG